MYRTTNLGLKLTKLEYSQQILVTQYHISRKFFQLVLAEGMTDGRTVIELTVACERA
jgi:hypothetical protein